MSAMVFPSFVRRPQNLPHRRARAVRYDGTMSVSSLPGLPMALFACVRNAGRSQMAAGERVRPERA